MLIKQLNEEEAEKEEKFLCQSLVSQEDKFLNPPFGMTYCVIEPGGVTAPDRHYDDEMWLILSGEGNMRLDEEHRKVKAGDLICMPNYSGHQLFNTSTEPLKFLSMFYDAPAYKDLIAPDYIIYSAFPTPNGKLHIGHLSGPYFAADVAKRFLSLRGASVVYCGGSDENLSYVPKKARLLGRPNEILEVANEFTAEIVKILKDFSALADNFLMPHKDPEYQQFVKDFFIKLVDNGQLQLKKGLYPFCEQCDIFVYESDVKGDCPHCKEITDGNNCEACGLYNDCHDLEGPVCKICDSACHMRESERYVFSLKSYRERLEKELREKSFPSRLRRSLNRMLDESLQEITVTWPCAWGIEAPNLPGQVICDDLETAAAYLYQAAKAKPESGYGYYWKDPKNKVVLTFGFDNSFCFLLCVPALMFAYDNEIKYPDAFLTNYFYLLEEKKFSTSRNHAIWGDDLLAQTDVDALRLYLALTRSERSENSFSMNEYQTFLHQQGVHGWDALMEKLKKLVCLPAIGEEAHLSNSGRVYLDNWQTLIQQCKVSFMPEQFSLNRVSSYIIQYRDSFAAFLEDSEAMNLIDWRLANAGLQGLAQILYPICPTYASALFLAAGASQEWCSLLELKACTPSFEPLPMDYFKAQLLRQQQQRIEAHIEALSEANKEVLFQ